MKLNDLKHGMVVKLRNGEYNIIDDSNEIKYLVSLDDEKMKFDLECQIHEFTNNMRHSTSRYDIMEVYKDMGAMFNENIKPIWSRNSLKDLKKGDMVWASSDECENKDWCLKKFVGMNDSDDNDSYKYRVSNIYSRESQCSYVYKYIKIAKPEDFNWFTEK